MHSYVQRIAKKVPESTKSLTQYTQYISTRAILAALNQDTEHIYKAVCASLASRPMKSKSLDTPDDQCLGSLPAESLNWLNFPGFPSHNMKIKVEMAIMLLRNLNINEGLFNGKRLLITKASERVLVVRIIIGPLKGKEAVL